MVRTTLEKAKKRYDKGYNYGIRYSRHTFTQYTKTLSVAFQLATKKAAHETARIYKLEKEGNEMKIKLVVTIHK